MKVYTFIDQDGHIIGKLASDFDRGEYQLDEINEAWQDFRNEDWKDYGDDEQYDNDNIIHFMIFYNKHYAACRLDLIDYHTIVEP